MKGERGMLEYMIPWFGGLISAEFSVFTTTGFIAVAVIAFITPIAHSVAASRFDRRGRA